MDSLIIKQEKGGEEDMEVQMDLQAGVSGLDGIQTFSAGDNLHTDHMGVGKQTFSLLSVPASSGSTTSQVRMVNLSNNVSQSEHITQGGSQILVCSAGQQSFVQTKAKKAGVADAQKNLTTKFIIAPKAAGSGQQQVLSVGPQGLQPIHNASANSGLIGQPSVATSLHVAGQTPTKTYTLSQGASLLSPQKLTSTGNIGLSKLTLSPAKTPPKISMISLAKSPPGKHQYVMLTKSGAATIPTPRAATSLSMSPPKVIIKGQTSVTVASGSQTPQTYIVSQAGSAPRPAVTASTSSHVQPLSVSGSKFQYVRLVTTPTSGAQNQANPVLRPPTIAPAPQRALAPAGNNPIKITMPITNQNLQLVQQQQQQQQQKSGALSQQRVILPATSQVLHSGGLQPATIRPTTAPSSASVPPVGPTINLQGLQGFALIPAQYLSQPQVQTPSPAPVLKQESYQVVQSNNNTTKHASNVNGRNSTASSAEPPGPRPRKPCNCTKSQCLKLYCDCFANGEFCSNCNCNNCFNNLDHEEERQRAIKTCLERNPHAFHPKIGKGRGGSTDRRHNKGCNCKRSGCLKNYCECYEAKILCSNLCKCVGCKNFEESPDRKTLMHLADAAEVRHQQQTAAKTKLSSQIQDLPSRPQHPATGEKLPYTFVTVDVAEATCSCLVAQAEEAERTRQQEMMEECMILQEFGRCLMHVIQSATRTKAPSPVP